MESNGQQGKKPDLRGKTKKPIKHLLTPVKGNGNSTNGHSYPPETREKVLQLLRDGATMQKIESTPGLPPWDTIQFWRFDASGAPTPFNSDFLKARAERADRWADLCVEETNEMPETCTHEQINRQRLRNGIRMWAASKHDPERYGDKPATNVQVGIALCLTEDQRLQLLARRERALNQ